MLSKLINSAARIGSTAILNYIGNVFKKSRFERKPTFNETPIAIKAIDAIFAIKRIINQRMT
jgi:hypothetical protein